MSCGSRVAILDGRDKTKQKYEVKDVKIWCLCGRPRFLLFFIVRYVFTSLLRLFLISCFPSPHTAVSVPARDFEFVVKTEHMESLLLVEDKNELRAMLRKALERAGYTVDEAPDGAAAIQKIRARRYLLVLTDLKLPGASGLEVLRASKSADPMIPVILLTAFGSVEEAVTAMKEGAFDFLQKPVDLDHLKLLVQRAAQQQEMLRENILLREEYAARYGFPRIVGEHSVDSRRQPADSARGGDGFDGAAARGKRDGQGAIRAGDSSFVASA